MEFRYAVESLNDSDEWRDRFVYGHPEPIDVVPGLSDNPEFKQIRVVLSREPLPTERYSGDPADPFRDATAAEIAAYDAALEAQAMATSTGQIMDVADLPASDPLRLQMRAMWCIAKKSGEVAEDTSFPDFLAWVAADQED